MKTDFENERRSLTGIAYRMLGSLSDAEDAVQEAFVRWHQHDNLDNHEAIENPHAYLTQITVRLCLDRMKSARAKREVYVGPWLPEPVLDTDQLRPLGADQLTELASDLSVALLLTLERLSPLERAAFILHDIFETDWSDVAKALGRNEAACRQLASRARSRVRDERRRFQPSAEERDRVLMAFGSAVSTGDVSALSKLLSADAVFLSDGGGEVKSALKPVNGRDRVVKLLVGLDAKARADGIVLSFETVMVNDLAGFIVRGSNGYVSTMAFELDEMCAIRAIYVVANPRKLKHLKPVTS